MSFEIYKKKWDYKKMMEWKQPIKHTGANCGELAISYLGLVDNSTCIKDSIENLKRGNYGRHTKEISLFLESKSNKYKIDFESELILNIDEFIKRNSNLVSLIGNKNETMVLLSSFKYNVGHYVVLAVVDNKIYLLDTSFNKMYYGSNLIEYLKKNHFYDERYGVGIHLLKMKKNVAKKMYSAKRNRRFNRIRKTKSKRRNGPTKRKRRVKTLTSVMRLQKGQNV